METRRRGKRGIVRILAAFLLLSCLGLLKTQAARRIELDRECSLTVSVEISSAVGGNGAYLEDFNQMEIPVSVYRVADVDVTGQKFTPEGAFAGLDLDKATEAGSLAVDWETMSAQAEAIREREQPDEVGSTVVKRSEGDGPGMAGGTVGGLTPGMYLVVPEAVYNPDYSIHYEFAPYLTALPSSDYTLTGEGSDEWVYDTTIGLKPDAVPQFGRLNITKDLADYNETLGPVTFVFEIIGRDGMGTVKYSEVESLTFSAAGIQTLTVEKIPAGLTVTVREVYSGASYEIEGSGEDTALVWSEEGVAAGVGPEAQVSFRNRYGGGNRGGYGVTNHFASDGAGGWIWNNPTD